MLDHDEIALRDRPLNAFTRIFADCRDLSADGALHGLSFAAKDLFDIAGYVTTAGAALRAGLPPARRDAEAVRRLRAGGAVLVGTTNMDEFAYGFVTDNAHYGITHNPHDLERLAGGSSGGSAAAVAARLVDFSIGSDTNGSIRIPASLCGVYGLRPTHGQVPEAGCFPFVERLDTVGAFARDPATLRRVHAVLADRALPVVDIAGIRVGVLSGWFREGADSEVLEGVEAIAASLGGAVDVELPLAAAARSAAFVLTAAEGGQRHLDDLRARPMAFDPATRDRLVAGAMIPPQWVNDAHEIASLFIVELDEALGQFDLLLTPSTPCVAPRIDEATIIVGGKALPARANLGIYAQPLSLAGVPVLSVPLSRPERLPIGVQLIAARNREDFLLSVADHLQRVGITGSDVPAPVRKVISC